MQFIWNEDQRRQTRILKGNFVFIQNSKPFGRTFFHMKGITFKWSAGSQANKCGDEKKGKVPSQNHWYAGGNISDFYYPKTPKVHFLLIYFTSCEETRRPIPEQIYPVDIFISTTWLLSITFFDLYFFCKPTVFVCVCMCAFDSHTHTHLWSV